MNGPYNRHRYDPDPDDSPAPCPTCGGTGKVYRPPLLPVPPVKQYIVPCPDCMDEKGND